MSNQSGRDREPPFRYNGTDMTFRYRRWQSQEAICNSPGDAARRPCRNEFLCSHGRLGNLKAHLTYRKPRSKIRGPLGAPSTSEPYLALLLDMATSYWATYNDEFLVLSHHPSLLSRQRCGNRQLNKERETGATHTRQLRHGKHNANQVPKHQHLDPPTRSYTEGAPR